MRSSSRVALGLLLAISMAALAIAQPRHPAPKGKAKVDAGVESTTDLDGAAAQPAAGDASTPTPMATSDAGGPVAPPSVLHGESGDGGVRPSPLNPAPNEFSQAIDAGAPSIDYDKLIGDISALRGRVAAVGDNLFHSRISIAIRTDGDHGRIGRLVVSVDDGAIFTAPSSPFKADDWQTIYAHALAPGRHAITVDVDRKDDRNDGFRNSQRSRFTVEVPRDQELGVQIKIVDDSSMGADFPGDKSGSYDLRVKMKAEARTPSK